MQRKNNQFKFWFIDKDNRRVRPAEHLHAPLSDVHCGSCPDLPRPALLCCRSISRASTSGARVVQPGGSCSRCGWALALHAGFAYSGAALAVSESNRAMARLGNFVRPVASRSSGR